MWSSLKQSGISRNSGDIIWNIAETNHTITFKKGADIQMWKKNLKNTEN